MFRHRYSNAWKEINKKGLDVDVTEVAKKISHDFVSSRLDNGNTIQHGLPDYQLDRLQCIHNTCAWILTLTKKFNNITPILKKLHWLPIKQRITFKLLTLTYQYQSDLLDQYVPTCKLRSSDSLLLKVQKSMTKSYGDMAFQNSAPRLWKSIMLSTWQCETLPRFVQKLSTT